jgi:deazaflavin-dependent oxidoreductase (nitroreductase family)
MDPKKLSFGVEYFILSRMPVARPQGLWRALFRVPVWLYRMGLGRFIGGNVLLLATTGRRTGLPRLTALGYGYEPDEDCFVVATGWPGGGDWYRNALVHRDVKIWARGSWKNCRAETVPAVEVERQYRALMAKNPYAPRIFSRWIGRRFSGSREDFRNLTEQMPMLSLRPENGG